MFVSSALATQITVASKAFPNWRYGGTTAEIRIFLNQRIVTSDGSVLSQGSPVANSWYKKVNCAVAGSTLTCDSFQIDSTTNSNTPTGTYVAYFYSVSGTISAKREDVIGNFRVPHTLGTSINWQQIATYNQGVARPADPTFYNANQTNAQILAYLNDYANTNSLVTSGDTRLVKDLSLYSNSLATAVSSIGATETVLTCTRAVTVSSSVSIPKNIKFAPIGECVITVAASQTLTIGTFIDPGNVKVFTSTASGAKVLFSKAAVRAINLAWWVGNTSGANITDALSEALESVNTNQGIIHVPTGQWLSSGGHIVAGGVTIEGEGNFVSAGYGTSIKLSSPSTTYLFKIGEGEFSIRFEKILLDGTVTTSKVGVYMTGQCPNTSGDILFKKVTFLTFNNGFEIFSDDVTGPPVCNGWQVAQVKFDTCIFQNNANAGIKTNSVNGQITTINTNFAPVPRNKFGIDCASCGLLTVIGGEHTGTLYSKNFVDGNVTTGTDTVTITAHGFTDGQQVYLTTTGVLPVTSPALGLTSKFVYIKYVDANNVQFSAVSGGAAIDITTAAGGGVHTVTNLSSGVIKISGAHPPINLIGTQDEGFATYIQNDASDASGIINLNGNLIQSKILLNQTCKINSNGNNYRSNSWKTTSPDSSVITSIGDFVNVIDLAGGNVGTAYLMDATSTGGGKFDLDLSSNNNKFVFRTPTRFLSPAINDSQPTIPIVGIGNYTATSTDKPALRIGRTDIFGTFDFYYDIYRKYSNGRLQILGNQTGFTGVDTNGDVTASRFIGDVVTPAQITSNQNNYSPGTTAQTIRLASDASHNITGFNIAQVANQQHWVFNVGSQNIVLKNQDASSTAANRLANNTGADITLFPNDIAFIQYDATVSRWRVGKYPSAEISTALTPSAAVAVNASFGNVFTLTPGEDESITVSNMTLGQTLKLIVLTSGTTSRTLTFSTGFKTSGTLATGTVSGKYFVLQFFCDAAQCYEISRTAAL